MPNDHVDVLIVGAGLSGIGAAHHLQERCPGKSYAILEAREAIGGTWDLFRYPGIRSDSDMHTLGYRFRPWTDDKSIAEGAKILDYVRDTAREGGIDRHIRFSHRVVSAAWSSEEALWTVEAERTDTGETVTLTCGFLFMNTGYYRYDEGYTPEFPGIDSFAGEVVHPQHWPEDLDYAGKRVVVIGSGATAMTLVPSMAKDAAKVTMLQRSPTYVISMPGEDGLAIRLRKHLPERVVYPIVRWKNVIAQGIFYRLSRKRPELIKKILRRGTIKALPAGYDVDKHFKPRYNPWDQRVCLVPDADLFKVLRDGSAEIATDKIKTFTADGIELESGAKLEADVVITATGLNLLFLGGMKITIDGAEPDLPRALTYKGMMLERLPQLRLHARLHQRLLDAEGRPHLRIHLPPAQLHGRERAPHRHADDHRPLHHRGAAAGLQLRLRPALTRPPAQTGLEGAVETAPELPGRPAHAAPRRDRRWHHALLQPGAATSARDPGPRFGLLIEVVDGDFAGGHPGEHAEGLLDPVGVADDRRALPG